MKPTLAALVTLTLAVGATAADPDKRVYELRTYTAAPGKFDALAARMKAHSIKYLKAHNITPHGFFTPADNKAGEMILVVSHDSESARKGNWEAFRADPEYTQIQKDTDKDGKLIAKQSALVLATTDYSPDISKFKNSDTDRIFELRTYTATPGNLDRLNGRFRDHTVKLFEKYGMTNVVYWNVAKGEKDADKMLVYLLAHPSEAAMKKAFNEFRLDPAWVSARTASEAAGGGSLTEAKGGVVSKVLKATDFSPMK